MPRPGSIVSIVSFLPVTLQSYPPCHSPPLPPHFTSPFQLRHSFIIGDVLPTLFIFTNTLCCTNVLTKSFVLFRKKLTSFTEVKVEIWIRSILNNIIWSVCEFQSATNLKMMISFAPLIINFITLAPFKTTLPSVLDGIQFMTKCTLSYFLPMTVSTHTHTHTFQLWHRLSVWLQWRFQTGLICACPEARNVGSINPGEVVLVWAWMLPCHPPHCSHPMPTSASLSSSSSSLAWEPWNRVCIQTSKKKRLEATV